MVYLESRKNVRTLSLLFQIQNKSASHWIVYKKTDEWYIEQQRMTTNDNEWQGASGKTNDNEWQRMKQRVATSDNEWNNEWQRVTTSGKANENEWQRMAKSKKKWQWVTVNDSEWYNEWKTNERK